MSTWCPTVAAVASPASRPKLSCEYSSWGVLTRVLKRIMKRVSDAERRLWGI
jgi:hypothetical protein